MAGSGGKGGGQAQQPTNVNQAAAQGLGNAMDFTNQAMGGPLNVGAFNNPYQQQVIDNTAQDIERQRQMAINNLGAQAQSAGAYSGSRQGVAEGVTNAEFGRMAGEPVRQHENAGLQHVYGKRYGGSFSSPGRC